MSHIVGKHLVIFVTLVCQRQLCMCVAWSHRFACCAVQKSKEDNLFIFWVVGESKRS